MTLVKKAPQEQNEQIIDLKVYWKVLMKSKWKILIFSFFITFLAIIYVSGLTPIYRATSSLLIESDQDKTVSIDKVYSLDTSRKEYFLTQFEIIKSRAITEEVIDKLNLKDNPEFMPSGEVSAFSKFKSDVKKQIKLLLPTSKADTSSSAPVLDFADTARKKKVALISLVQSRITVSPIRNTQLVYISFEAKDPKLAAEVANAVAKAYINQGLTADLNSTKRAASWISERLEILKENVDESDEELQEYRLKENLIDIEAKGVRSIASSELESLTRSYLIAREARFKAETISRFVSNVENNDVDSLLSLPDISNHESVKSIKSIEIDAAKKVSELSIRYGDKHPKLISAKAELAAIQKSLQQQVNKLVEGIDKELKAAKDNEYRLKQSLDNEKEKYQIVTNKQQTYLKLVREAESNRELYDAFLLRFKETNITTNLETEKAEILDVAEIPTSPVKPRKSMLVGLAFFGSFMFAVVLAFVFDVLNSTFRSPAEIESKLRLRLLGVVPLIKVKRKKTLPLHAFFQSQYKIFSEAIRTLRTGYILTNIESNEKTVLVTSSIPGEGKTTTAINIAFSMAQVEKTILIEADLRRPSFTRVFSLAPYQKGLSDLVSGTANLKESIIHDETSGLDILSAGLIPPNPLEILSSDNFSKLLTVLSQDYDRIVIDSPPTLAVSDAMVLSKLAESAIYVVRADSTKQTVAKQGVDRLVEVGAKIDGIVLNRVNIKKYKGTMEYAGYYDSYGYGQGSKDEKKLTKPSA